MKARHVWVLFAFVFGFGIFANEMQAHWMWQDHGVWESLDAGAAVTAGVLMVLATILTWCDE